MFKIDFFVKDKDLGEIMKRLAGVALNVNHVYVPNLEADRSGRVSQTANDSMDLVEKSLRKLGGTINADKMREAVQEAGLKPASYSNILSRLQKEKRLKKTPGSTYRNATYSWVK